MSGNYHALSIPYQMHQAKKVKALEAINSKLRAEKQALVGLISKTAESINGIGHQLNYIENNAEKAALYLIAAELRGVVSPNA